MNLIALAEVIFPLDKSEIEATLYGPPFVLAPESNIEGEISESCPCGNITPVIGLGPGGKTPTKGQD